MGLSLPKLAPGVDEKKKTELERIIGEEYDEHVKNTTDFLNFYRAVCHIIERLNENFGNTQIKLPEVDDLRKEFQNRHIDKNKAMTKAEFQEIMKNLVKKTTFTGIGAKELLLYIFGVPLTALLIKQRVMPQAVADEVFIPGVTSVTVFTLAALNKI